MRKSILIIEDNEKIRKAEKEYLESEGYSVFDSGNAKEGLELALNNPLDLVILDIRLPSKKRGIGLAKIFRNNEKTKDVPIVFVTGYSEGESTKEITGIDNYKYITKPFKLKDLLFVIKEKLK